MKNLLNKSVIIIGLIIVLIVVVVIVRKNNHQEPVSSEQIVTESTPISYDGDYCFSKTFNKDVTDVKLAIFDAKVSGTMNWIPFEKDSARGTLMGIMLPGGEMKVLYDYMIEGSRQTEEKFMKIEDGKLFIKHGELEDKKYDGNLTYKDPETAVYNEVLEPCI